MSSSKPKKSNINFHQKVEWNGTMSWDKESASNPCFTEKRVIFHASTEFYFELYTTKLHNDTPNN